MRAPLPFRWVAPLALILATALPCSAQVTGSIAGTVKDASGAVLPGATIIVTGPALQRERAATAVSGSDGTYRFPLLPPGVYDLTVELAGFKPVTRQAIEVAINQQTTVDLALGPATVTEAVSVTGTASVLETTTSDITSRVSTRTIDALPLNGRNFTDLVALVPGARPKSAPTATPVARSMVFRSANTEITWRPKSSR